jgi:hypothetical protein
MNLKIGGKDVEGEHVDIVSSDEPWAVIALSDGAMLRVKVVIKNVFRLEDKDAVTGLPTYQFFMETVSAVDHPK